MPWHGVIDRRLAIPPCSRRVDKGVEKGVETLSRFHGSVTGSRSSWPSPAPSSPLGTRDMHHPAVHLHCIPWLVFARIDVTATEFAKLCATEMTPLGQFSLGHSRRLRDAEIFLYFNARSSSIEDSFVVEVHKGA